MQNFQRYFKCGQKNILFSHFPFFYLNQFQTTRNQKFTCYCSQKALSCQFYSFAFFFHLIFFSIFLFIFFHLIFYSLPLPLFFFIYFFVFLTTLLLFGVYLQDFPKVTRTQKTQKQFIYLFISRKKDQQFRTQDQHTYQMKNDSQLISINL